MKEYRDYLNDHPACRAKTQAEFLDGTVYTEVKGGHAFAALLKSIRKGDVVRVYRPFLLAPAHGGPAKKRRLWAERADAIKARGGCVRSIDPPLQGAKLAIYAAEEISNVAKGRAGKGRQGRPKKAYTDDELRVIDHYWPPRKGWTVERCVAAINEGIKPRRVTRGWLYIRKPIGT